MGKFAKELIESMQQAAKHATSKKARGLRVSKVEFPDVKAIRLSLGMSQHHFAAAYRIPLSTLKNWEQGRRMPDAPALAYLLAIKRLGKGNHGGGHAALSANSPVNPRRASARIRNLEIRCFASPRNDGLSGGAQRLLRQERHFSALPWPTLGARLRNNWQRTPSSCSLSGVLLPPRHLSLP